jgi:hypothetical protein
MEAKTRDSSPREVVDSRRVVPVVRGGLRGAAFELALRIGARAISPSLCRAFSTEALPLEIAAVGRHFIPSSIRTQDAREHHSLKIPCLFFTAYFLSFSHIPRAHCLPTFSSASLFTIHAPLPPTPARPHCAHGHESTTTSRASGGDGADCCCLFRAAGFLFAPGTCGWCHWGLPRGSWGPEGISEQELLLTNVLRML